MKIADDPNRQSVTRLDAFCLANDIGTAQLADAAGVSRQQIGRMRYWDRDLRIKMAKRVASGASRIMGRTVRIAELFDLGEYG